VNLGWSLDRGRLADALERWLSTNPSPHTRALVNEWLMDLVLDPLRRGREKGDTGIFFGRVVGTNIGVIYALTPRGWLSTYPTSTT